MILEHANVTVSNPEESAALFTRLFGWHVRWQGRSGLGGRTVHVGTDDAYLALYTTERDTGQVSDTDQVGSLKHLGIVVPDLDEVEKRVRAEGIEPFNFGDYDPGKRFYFLDPDGIEFEIVSYN